MEFDGRLRSEQGDDDLLTTCLAKGDSGPDDMAPRRFSVHGDVESEFCQTQRRNVTTANSNVKPYLICLFALLNMC